MKKIFTLFCGICIALFATSQSQRLICFEEFTGQNCGPCGATNPDLNTLLNANSTKVVSIKYMSPHGSSAPASFYNNNKTDVDARSNYYSNSVAPHGYLDGANSAFTNTDASDGPYGEHPGNLTQTHINNEYGLTSAFNVNVSHTISSDYDSIYVTVVITATQAATGTFKARVAVIERDLNFSTPPGLNGETQFEGMMKKMLPNAAGTTLPTTYAIGDSTVLNLSWKFGTYMYDYGQVAVVAFVQDDATKATHQAGYSAPLPVTFPDAGMSAIASLPVYQCGVTSISPTVTLKNLGNTTITSATINAKIDNGTPTTQAWTGSLAPGANTSVTLNPITVTTGSHTLTVYNSDANGSTDYNSLNSTTTKKFTIAGAPSAVPLVEGYTSTTFPPAGWAVDDIGADAVTWTRKTGAGGFGNSTACAKMDLYNSLAGQEDAFITPPFDLSTSGFSQLTFNVAYAQYQTENDVLEVLVTTDCGITWTSKFSKSGSALSTAPATTSSFTPTAAQWRAETVSLSAFDGQPNVIVKFYILSDYGNNLYLDDINITSAPAGISKINFEEGIQLFPNPSTGILFLNSVTDQNTKVLVYNSLGEIVFESRVNLASGNNSMLDLSKQPNGIYTVKMVSDNNTTIKKVTLSR